jgi:hypothetical protein
MSDQKKILPIDYTHREFNTIRGDLLQIAERFYPDTFQDFSEGSFAAIMTDMVAYVGDQLSFYLDYNVNEAFLDTAYQYDNVLRHGRALGYKYTGRPSTYGKAAIYVLVPASATGIGPDRRYIPIMKRSSRFTSDSGLNFVLTENVDFNSPENPIVAARTDAATGAPTFYAIKAYGQVVSGYFSRETIIVGAYERFKRVEINNSNMAEIISVTDSDGNEYFEVDYLAQDIVFKEVSNRNYRNDNVPSILKPYLVSRKFVVERTRSSTILQFGSGNPSESNVVADPTSVAMDIFGKDYVTDTTFDPTRLSKTESYGIVPSNTTLAISYRNSSPLNSNLAVGSLNKASNPILEFEDRQSLNSSTISTIVGSVEVSNEEPIVGNVTNATTSEIKRRIFDTFPTQNRAVTQSDYENIAYRMPAKFGSIKRCSAQKDPNSSRRNLNLYIISENKFNKLVTANSAIKNNLKTWLNHYRMINDTIDIIDAFVINFGIEFVVSPTSGADKFELIDACVRQLQTKYKTHFYIGEPISISEIYKELSKVRGVMDVVSVRVTGKSAGNYSGVKFNINRNLSPAGDYVIIPKNAVAELKFAQIDIKGRIR